MNAWPHGVKRSGRRPGHESMKRVCMEASCGRWCRLEGNGSDHLALSAVWEDFIYHENADSEQNYQESPDHGPSDSHPGSSVHGSLRTTVSDNPQVVMVGYKCTSRIWVGVVWFGVVPSDHRRNVAGRLWRTFRTGGLRGGRTASNGDSSSTGAPRSIGHQENVREHQQPRRHE